MEDLHDDDGNMIDDDHVIKENRIQSDVKHDYRQADEIESI